MRIPSKGQSSAFDCSHSCSEDAIVGLRGRQAKNLKKSLAVFKGNYAYTYQTGSQHLISGITAPLHTVTNTWEPSRNVLDTKQNNIVNNLISSYDYTVNEIGQRETVLTDGIAFGNTDRGWQWGYDALGQVTSATHAAETDLDHAYQYDAIGNRLFAETANTEISDPPVAATTTYSPNSLNC